MDAHEHGTAGQAGVGALSWPARIAVAVALGAVAVTSLVHLAMVFLHVAPANTVSTRHAGTIDGYVYPEFEQNWKLFAPNPLQQNIAVQARAEIMGPDGGVSVTRWTNLTARDAEAVRHNPVPSHVHQNELRRAWDFFTGSHDEENRPNGLRGALSEEYLRRIVLSRIGPETAGAEVLRVQVRSATTPVRPPAWTTGGEGAARRESGGDTVHRELPWWPVGPGDVPGSARPGQAAVVSAK